MKTYSVVWFCEDYEQEKWTYIFGFASIKVFSDRGIAVTATIFDNKVDVLHFDWSPGECMPQWWPPATSDPTRLYATVHTVWLWCGFSNVSLLVKTSHSHNSVVLKISFCVVSVVAMDTARATVAISKSLTAAAQSCPCWPEHAFSSPSCYTAADITLKTVEGPAITNHFMSENIISGGFELMQQSDALNQAAHLSGIGKSERTAATGRDAWGSGGCKSCYITRLKSAEGKQHSECNYHWMPCAFKHLGFDLTENVKRLTAQRQPFPQG